MLIGQLSPDFLIISGDAFVDHPSFGVAVIRQVLLAEGYSVSVLAQPSWQNTNDFKQVGQVRLGVLISAGNIDSMVAHYTAAKKKRSNDMYSPSGKAGMRPDRATIVYSNLARQVFGKTPIILGGLEASLRRFAHYDYWSDKIHPSVLVEARADLLVYGMGERSTRIIADRLSRYKPLKNIDGTCVLLDKPPENAVFCASFNEVMSDKKAYATSTVIQYDEHDPVRGRTIVQAHNDKYLVCYKPSKPLTTKELDIVAQYPFSRKIEHYDEHIPAIEEVQFSLIHNRGCFGGCHFCSLAFHQGRFISTRSIDSLVKEAETISNMQEFKGYIHDVGGPTANFRHNSCKKQEQNGMCKRNCLVPTPCENVDASHAEYLKLLRRLREIDGVKKVFVRSGIRFDYLMLDKSGECFSELVKHHISGQLKVAPEHCQNHVLDLMGKPHWETYLAFQEKYNKLNVKAGKNQFLVPYLISSHPGSTLQDAISLAQMLKKQGRQPEQVQDFYPTPGTLSTCMYYTEMNPRTLAPMYVAKTSKDKAMQRALLQWANPKNRQLVNAALVEAGQEQLIGFDKNCLIRPFRQYNNSQNQGKKLNNASEIHENEKKPAAKKPASDKSKINKLDAKNARFKSGKKRKSRTKNN